jgi:hypothetical protein
LLALYSLGVRITFALNKGFTMKIIFYSFLFFLICSQQIQAQRLIQFESEHFVLKTTPKLAPNHQNYLHMLEDAYQKLASFYDHTLPAKVEAVFLDTEDFSNGMALSSALHMVVFVTPSSFTFRRQGLYLENVTWHELSHLFTLHKMGDHSKYFGTEISATFLKNSFMHSYQHMIPSRHTPMWLAEGLAQLGSWAGGFDTLDAWRQMLLKDACRYGYFADIDQMQNFFASARQSEQIYNQGFFFTHYLYETYGIQKLNSFMVETHRTGSVNKAFINTFAKSQSELFKQWQNSLGTCRSSTSYNNYDHYQSDLNPVFTSPSNHSCKITSGASNYGASRLECNDQTIATHVEGTLKTHPTQDAVLFRTLEFRGSSRAKAHLHIWNPMASQKVSTLSGSSYLTGAWDLNGNLYLVTFEGNKFTLLEATKSTSASTNSGYNYPRPKATPVLDTYLEYYDIQDIQTGPYEQTLLITFAGAKGYDVALYYLEHDSVTFVLQNPANELNPIWHQDHLYFTGDYTGRLNICRTQLHSAPIECLETQHASGYMQPAFAKNALHYVTFRAGDYTIVQNPNPQWSPIEPSQIQPVLPTKRPRSPLEVKAPHKFVNSDLSFKGWSTAINYLDRDYTNISTNPNLLQIAAPARRLMASSHLYFTDPTLHRMLQMSATTDALNPHQAGFLSTSMLYLNRGESSDHQLEIGFEHELHKRVFFYGDYNARKPFGVGNRDVVDVRLNAFFTKYSNIQWKSRHSSIGQGTLFFLQTIHTNNTININGLLYPGYIADYLWRTKIDRTDLADRELQFHTGIYSFLGILNSPFVHAQGSIHAKPFWLHANLGLIAVFTPEKVIESTAFGQGMVAVPIPFYTRIGSAGGFGTSIAGIYPFLGFQHNPEGHAMKTAIAPQTMNSDAPLLPGGITAGVVVRTLGFNKMRGMWMLFVNNYDDDYSIGLSLSL